MDRKAQRLAAALEIAAAVPMALWLALLLALWRSPALVDARAPWLVMLALAVLFYTVLWALSRRPGREARRRGRARPFLQDDAGRVYRAALMLLVPLGFFCRALSMVVGGGVFAAFMVVFLLALAAGVVGYVRSRRAGGDGTGEAS